MNSVCTEAKWDTLRHADGRTYGEGTIDVAINAGGHAPPPPPPPPALGSVDAALVEDLVARFQTARELHARLSTAPPVTAIAGPYLMAGAITKLDGKAKSAGKTSLGFDLAAAVVTGAHPFSGTRPVVYLIEQTDAALRPALKRAGLADHPDLHLLRREDVEGFEWPEIVAACGLKAQRVQARVVIIDTVHQFAALHDDSENSGGAVLRIMKPLQTLASENVGVWIVAHDRKSGGRSVNLGEARQPSAGRWTRSSSSPGWRVRGTPRAGC